VGQALAADGDSRVRYRFGPLERRGIVAGWRGGQIATVAASLVVAVLIVRADSSVTGAVAALVVVGAAVGAATWPVGGRTLEEWAPDAVRHASGARRRRRVRTDPFARLRVLPVELTGSPGARAGVILDETSRAYCAVLRASGAGFVLLSEEEKVQQIGAWASVLSALAREGSAVHRVQWVARNLRAAPIVDTPGNGGAPSARRSYSALLEAHGELSRRQEVLVALSVRPARGVRRGNPTRAGHVAACSSLLREAGTLRRRLADARIDAGIALSPEALERVIRDAFEREISSAVHRASGEIGCGSMSGVAAAAGSQWRANGHVKLNQELNSEAAIADRRPASWPWPMALHPEWGRVQVEGTWHVTYWVSEWPRTEVGPDFLGPLLLVSEARVAVSVVMEPLGPIQAARRIEQARTADVADSELRRRGGFLATARRRREEETLAQREVELADGHAPYRFSGYVTVSAADPDELEDVCGRVEQAAARCGLELRVCFGDQAGAFCSTLPICRGLS